MGAVGLGRALDLVGLASIEVICGMNGWQGALQGWFYPSTRQRCLFGSIYRSQTRQVTRQKPSATRQVSHTPFESILHLSDLGSCLKMRQVNSCLTTFAIAQT